MKQKVIVIAGPTASGKTNLSVELAKMINGEIICADSMQIYKEMNICTAKPTKEEMKDIPHYLFDIVEPNESFNVVKYKEMAEKCIDDILSRGKIPILVGGTGLYVDSLINNIVFSESNINQEYREKLSKIASEQGNEVIYSMLKEIDEDICNQIHLNDTKRIIRALEIYNETGKNRTYYNKLSKLNEVKYNYILFGITMDREKLYQRINLRVELMIEQGMIEEVKKIYNKYNSFPTSMQALGYKEVVQYLNNEIDYNEMIEKIKMETRRYAKRQLTWFKRYKNMVWLDVDNINMEQIIEIINI